MVLVQKQIWRPVEQNRRHRYESRQLHLLNFWQWCQKHTMEKIQNLLKTIAGKSGYLPAENWN
jgi:hypothetical protein